ncbi:serine/threonine-protein kinase [Actinophytocola sp. KF-1]
MDLDDSRTATAGTRLLGGRYRLGPLLGRGGSGRVYEAVDVVLGRVVAVKVFQPGSDAGARYRFAAEARLLADLCHPGLVTVHDVCLDGDAPFMVMRLVDGPTLRDLLDRGPLAPAAVARTGARLADVLAHVHARDIVHRDLKPANVLIDAAGDCHLTDFGLARALRAVHLTVSGEFVGTAAYLAPEQITDAEVGPAADVYALGLLLLECLTGRTEYTGTTVEAALARLNRPPRIPGALPHAWRTLLTAMTARDPKARPSAARCATVLSAIAEGRTPKLTLPIPAPRHADDARPARLRPVHAGLTVLALAAAFAVAGTTTAGVSGSPTSESPEQPPPTGTTAVPSTEPPARAPRPAPRPQATPVAEPATSADNAPVTRRAPDHRGQGNNTRVPGKAKGKHTGRG